MAKYYVRVVNEGNGWHVLVNLPSGVFTRGPMSEEEALDLAADMKVRLLRERPPWWEKLLFWRSKSESPPPPEEERVLRCPRHPQWKAVYIKGKWVCSFCQKELEGRRGDD